MADDEKVGSGKPELIIFDDVVKVLDSAEPADLCSELDKVFEKRSKTSNQAKAKRLHEEAERMLREMPEGNIDKLDEFFSCVVKYFEEYDPEPLLVRLISSLPLSRGERLLLVSALAGLATSDGGNYGRVFKKVPNPRGRPFKVISSEEIIEVADRVAEVQKEVGKKELAVETVARERGISPRSVWKILNFEHMVRKTESG